MKVGSLFSGIGGLDLGLEQAGMEIVWQVEFDPYCQKVLAKHWPEVPRYGDIKEIDFTTLPAVDLICGGFPCQPVSCAGKRQGDQDERWLWPEFYRAVCETRPRYVLVENVPGLLSAADGRLFGGILGDLARCGYDAEWDLLPPAAFGAPHLRYRMLLVAWLQAHPSCSNLDRFRSYRKETNATGQSLKIQPRNQQSGIARQVGQVMAHAPERQDLVGESGNMAQEAAGRKSGNAAPGNGSEVVADCGRRPMLRITRGIFPERGEGAADLRRRLSDQGWWSVEPDVGRMAHGIPARVDRLKCLGNAVVPQVAEWIGRRIMEEKNQIV